MLRDPKVGDRVTKRGGYWDGDGISGFAVIAKVSKLKVALEDGTEWRISDGAKWGTSRDGYTLSPWIAAFTENDLQELKEQRENRKRKKLAHQLSNVRWYDIPLPQLEAVLAILRVEGPKDDQSSL